MILVDTSVLIDFLKRKTNPATEKFQKLLELNIPFGITSPVYQELLQGSATEKDFNLLKKYLDTLRIYSPLDEKESYSEAAKIYFECRRKGITIRSTIDCLIVQIVLEHRLKLLHNDKDFEKIQEVIKNLDFF